MFIIRLVNIHRHQDSGNWAEGLESRGCWGHIWTLLSILYKSCHRASSRQDTWHVRYVTIETVPKHTQTVRKFNLTSVTKVFPNLMSSVNWWCFGCRRCASIWRNIQWRWECSGARCEWEGGWCVLTMELSRPRHCDNDATSSEHHHREYSHQAHLANSTSSSLPILQGGTTTRKGDPREFF